MLQGIQNIRVRMTRRTDFHNDIAYKCKSQITGCLFYMAYIFMCVLRKTSLSYTINIYQDMKTILL